MLCVTYRKMEIYAGYISPHYFSLANLFNKISVQEPKTNMKHFCADG